MFSARQRRLLAVVVGVTVAVATMTAFTLWLHALIDRQGREEVDIAAQRAIRLSDMRIDAAVTTLTELARLGVDSCSSGHVDALRQAAFYNPSVKEIALVSREGQVLCSSFGAVAEPRTVESSGRAEASGKVAIDAVRLGNGQMMLRVMKRNGTMALAALIPAALFSPKLSLEQHAPGAHVRVALPDGTTVVERGHAPGGLNSMLVRRMSNRHGLTATVSLSREALRSEAERLKVQALAVASAIFVAVLAFAALLARRRRHDPYGEFEQAIAANEFVPYYQPVVDIRTGRLRGVEVLVRWRKPDGLLVSPSSFIPFAESSGLIVPLTRALMRRVSEGVGDAIGCRPDVKIGFNLAAPHFADDRIVSDVRDIFEDSPIALRQVVLEITERQPLENLVAARRVIAGLQGLGCGVAIDDVGTGHGGLSYILKLGADTIKIDKLFVDAIGSEHHSTTILETLVDLARSMRMDVVAEGVENFEQVLQLRDLGILAAQGNVFCPPLPSTSFLQLIEAIAPLPQNAIQIEGSRSEETRMMPSAA